MYRLILEIHIGFKLNQAIINALDLVISRSTYVHYYTRTRNFFETQIKDWINK
jgi:hypothetical protein